MQTSRSSTLGVVGILMECHFVDTCSPVDLEIQPRLLTSWNFYIFKRVRSPSTRQFIGRVNEKVYFTALYVNTSLSLINDEEGKAGGVLFSSCYKGINDVTNNICDNVRISVPVVSLSVAMFTWTLFPQCFHLLHSHHILSDSRTRVYLWPITCFSNSIP